MQKVVDYKLVKWSSAAGLTRAVTKEMADGWVPSGTVVAFHDQLIQAMVKFEGA